MGAPICHHDELSMASLRVLGEARHLSFADRPQLRDPGSDFLTYSSLRSSFPSPEMAEFLSRTRRSLLWGPQACARNRSQAPGLCGGRAVGMREEVGRVEFGVRWESLAVPGGGALLRAGP